MFPMTKYDTWKGAHWGPQHLKFLEDYFPSHVERAVAGLLRKGWVERKETPRGMVVQITKEGKKQILCFDLEKLQPKTGKWDGKWRIVFFDIAELSHAKRDRLRRYLKQMALYCMQESVYVTPYDCEKEVMYLREVLGVPHGVKMGVLESLENSDDLKKIFKL